ncbi:MAG TPA: hypothetical protein VG935_00130, partial [Patescibacteria group bacterium]|nr:hypothetical protein [Patescibacteria group bacterium]
LDFAAYRIPRQNFYLGQHPWPVLEQHIRLFKRDSLIKWHGQLHETPEVKGKVGQLSAVLIHYTHRDLNSMVEKTNVWSETEAKLRLKAHHPEITWWRFPRVMLQAFYHSYIVEKGWKVGTAGVVESIYQAFSIFITYAKLWELQQENRQK